MASTLVILLAIVSCFHVLTAHAEFCSGNPNDVMRMLASEWVTTDDTLGNISCLADTYFNSSNCLSVFLEVYKIVTTDLNNAINSGVFHNGTWMAEIAIAFGNMYRTALYEFLLGNLTAVPGSWRIAHTLAKSDTGLVLEYLLLGMNAHINRDLAHGVAMVGTSPDSDLKLEDYQKMNDILITAFNQSAYLLAEKYIKFLMPIYNVSQSLEDLLFGKVVWQARSLAWDQAIELETNYAATSALIESTSTGLANLLIQINSNRILYLLLRTLEHNESCKPH